MAFQMATVVVLLSPAEPHCQFLQLHQEGPENLLPKSSKKLETIDRLKHQISMESLDVSDFSFWYLANT